MTVAVMAKAMAGLIRLGTHLDAQALALLLLKVHLKARPMHWEV
jgi:hypothetical protein